MKVQSYSDKSLILDHNQMPFADMFNRRKELKKAAKSSESGVMVSHSAREVKNPDRNVESKR